MQATAEIKEFTCTKEKSESNDKNKKTSGKCFKWYFAAQ